VHLLLPAVHNYYYSLDNETALQKGAVSTCSYFVFT
jgi:hypothetical protein